MSWLDGYGGHRPPRQPDQTTAQRAQISVICCGKCGRWDCMRRRQEYGQIAYWECEACHHRQKEPVDAGRKTGHVG